MGELATKDLMTLEWWTLPELATRWRFSLDSLLRWVKEGRLEARKFPGGQYRVHRAVVEKFEGANVKREPRARRQREPAILDLLGDVSRFD